MLCSDASLQGAGRKWPLTAVQRYLIKGTTVSLHIDGALYAFRVSGEDPLNR